MLLYVSRNRLTIDLPDTLHKTLKSLSIVDNETMRNIAISALEGYVKLRIGNNDITEKQAEKLLEPILMQYSKEIKEGSFEGKSWEEVKKSISKNKES